MLPDLHTLWVGPRLNWLAQLCLASWLAHGHKAVLWTYQAVEMVPSGVEVRNAREILPETAIVRHRASGSVALFADRFRYHLLQRHPVTWLDADVLLLHPIADESPYLFGWEHHKSICSAVLRLPADSPVLQDLLALIGARVPVPQWWPLRDRLWQQMLGLVGRHETLEIMAWGTIGPRALTETLRRHKLTDQARSTDVFYPILWWETDLFWQSPEIVEARLTRRTLAVHLWSTSSLTPSPEMAQKRNAPLPMKSWIGQKCISHGVNMPIAPAYV